MSDSKHLASIEGAVFVPFLQAGVTGGAVGLIAGSVAVVNGGQFFVWAAVFGGGVFLLHWLSGLSWWRGAMAPLPEPAAVVLPSESVRVELVQDNGHWVDWLNLPMSLDTVIGAACHLVSQDYNTANLGGAGRVLTRAEAELLRDWMIAHEMAAWRRPGAHTAGWDMSGAGRALMRRLAAMAEEVPTSPELMLPAGWSYRREEHTHTNAQNP